MASERLAEIGLDAALRALEAQERAVEQLRSRTGMLLTASSLVASFFGGGAIRYGRAVGPPVAFALTVLIASILLCVYILVPKHELTFTLDAEDAYERLVGHDDAEINRHILVWLTAFARENQVELAGLDRAYLLAAICLVLQLCAWSIPLFASIR